MQLTITVGAGGEMTMTAEGEAFELALFARSVGKAAPAHPSAMDAALAAPRAIAGEIIRPGKPSKPPKPKRTSSPTCATCGGRGHRSNHCPSKATG